MTTHELLNKINASELSESTKQAIQSVLAGHEEVSAELETSVRELIQKEIDADFAELGVTDDLPEVQAINDQLDQDIDAVEKQLEADLAYVDAEIAELDEMRKTLTGVEERMQIEDLQDKLQG